VEEQGLEISYFRVPTLYNHSTSATLSGYDTVDTFAKTNLQYTVNAYYKKSYDTGFYATSSWEQSQVLEVLPVSADAFGVSYGELTASSMGPQGNVITTRPWKRRREWNTSTDTSTNETAFGCSYMAGVSGAWYSGFTARDQMEFFGQLVPFAIPRGFRGYPLADWDPFVAENIYPRYTIQGTYSVTQETKVQMINFIDGIGDTLATSFGGYFSIPVNTTTLPSGGIAFEKDQKVVSYDSDRHDWSGD
jgi:hypothetical protein